MEDPCPICYETIDASSGHCTLPCKHTFHFHCLHTWADKNTSCPMCRTNIAPEQTSDPPVITIVRRSRALINLRGVYVSEEDIAFVMDQCGVTRGDACRELSVFDGDIIDTVHYFKEVATGDLHGPHDYNHISTEMRAYWNLQTFFDTPSFRPLCESKRVVRWRSARGSTRGDKHECVHWDHLDGVSFLDKDGYDTD
jgi:hypothetical protein